MTKIMTEEHKRKLAEGRRKKIEENGGERAKAEYNPIIRAKNNPKSKAMALIAMCSHCFGCTEEGIEPGWRSQVRNCTAYQCPLWPHRPK